MSLLSAPAVEALDRPGYPMSVAAYHAMIADGTLDADDPVELIEGELLFKVGKNKPHRRSNTRFNRWLNKNLPAGWAVQVQDPITLSTSEPEPDLCCVTEASVDASDPHPTAADVGLVIEVFDTTLAFDRYRKLRMYARAGIVEYWIVNLIDRQIEVHTQPDADGSEPRYASRVVFTIDQTIALPAALGGASIAVADLLPPA